MKILWRLCGIGLLAIALLTYFLDNNFMYLVNIVSVFLFVGVCSYCRKNESIWLFVLVGVFLIPMNIRLCMHSYKWLEMVLMYGKIGRVVFRCMIYVCLFCMEEILFGIIGRIIWRRQSKYVYTNFILLICLTFALMGCGNEDNAKVGTQEEQAISDVFQTEQTIERSIDDVTVHSEPLVERETRHYSTGYTYIIDYTYDSKNRYSRIQQSYIEPGQDEQLSDWIAEYSYDDYFYYVTTTYLMKDNMVTTSIYDIYDNPIQSQYEGINGMVTEHSQYKYLCDTKEKQEVIRYTQSDEKDEWEYSHSIKQFNDHGDLICLIQQIGSYSLYEEMYEYEYDADDRIIRCNKNFNDINFVEILYSYDDSGRLVELVEKHTNNRGEKFWEYEYQVIRTYEYDEYDRLIKEEQSRFEQEEEEARVTVIVYEYVE